MTDGTTTRYNEGEVLTGVQRRRRWTPEEKVQIVEERYQPGMSVSLVGRRHGISGSQIFAWRQLGTHINVSDGADKGVMRAWPASMPV
jgi:transposase